MYTMNDDGSLDFDVDGVKLRNLTAEPRAAMVVDAMGPKRGVAMQGRVELIAPKRARLLRGDQLDPTLHRHPALQGRVELIAPKRARLLPSRKFTWGL